MATNNFSKEERVAFEEILEGFNDSMVISKAVSTYGTQGQLMERAGDTIWRPMPYILNSQDRVIGTPIAAQNVKQLSVPSTLGFKKNVSWSMNTLELRDALQEGRLGASAKQRMASDINTIVRDLISTTSSVVVKVTGPATGYAQIARAESTLDDMGVQEEGRYLALTSTDYNGLADNLASRQTMTGKPTSAYERSYVGTVAGFETLKTDGGKRLVAAPAAITMATNGAQVRYVPKAAESTVAGDINVDNRFQQITVSATAGVTAGCAFTVAGLEAVHLITKESTGLLKTYRVISVDSGTTMTITPPMIGANSSPTDAEKAYKNVNVATTSASAAISWLNTTATAANPFWVKDSVEILPGRYAVPTDQGPAVMRGTTDQGIELVMTKTFDASTFESAYTFDTLFGVVNLNTEMNGVILFNQ